MDRVSFVFSLLLIFSVTLATFGSVIKAKNPNGEVKNETRLLLPMIKISARGIRRCLSLNFHGIFGPFYAMNELRIVTLA